MWLGLDVSYGSCCPLCPEIALDPLGHHAITSKRDGDVVSRHNKQQYVMSLRSPVSELIWVSRWKWVAMSPPNHSHTCPADLLVPNWVLGKPAAFDLSVTSPLNLTIILEASVTTGAAAWTTEQRTCLGSWWENHLELGFNIINPLMHVISSVVPRPTLT